jgi:ABC-type transporter Mla MlaB component
LFLLDASVWALLWAVCQPEDEAMLRITIHDTPQQRTLQLEGRLAGAWVQVLEFCWDGSRKAHPGRAVHIDLTGVTFVDAAGRQLLAALHRRGATFLAAGCLSPKET